MRPTITGSRAPGRASRRGARVQRAGHFLDAIRLDQVADFDVVEILDSDAALETFPHLAGIILEPLERCQRPVIHLDAIADDPDARGPRDDPAAHEAPRDRSDLR